MGVIKRESHGIPYEYYRFKDRTEILLGREGSDEAKEKLRQVQREEILSKIKVLRTNLEKLSDPPAPPGLPPKIDASNLPLDKPIRGDAFQTLKEFPDNCIHMAITSPPYNLDLPYDLYVDKKDYNDYRASLKKVWEQTFRVLVEGGRFALNIAPTGISSFKEIHHDLVKDVKEAGFTLRTEILWYKQNMGRNTAWGSWKSPSNPHIVPSWEYVFVFHKHMPYLQGDKEDIDITAEEFKSFSDGFWNISPHSKKNGHPAPFPEDLIYRLIKFYTYKGNIVLDMFAGSGTVGVVALRTERHFVCIDISKQYTELAERRIDEVRKQGKIEVPIRGLEKYK